MGMDKACYCFIWLVLTCGTIAIFTASVTPNWLDNNNTEDHEGIFQRCTSQCDVIKFWQPKLPEAARLCMIACMGFLVLATMLSCVSPCVQKDISFAFTLIDIAAFMTCVASMVIYTIEYKDKDGYSWGWSYVLCWVGCGLHGIGLILLCWAGLVDSE